MAQLEREFLRMFYTHPRNESSVLICYTAGSVQCNISELAKVI